MDFNQIINRNNTGSVKWDFIERHFGDGAETAADVGF